MSELTLEKAQAIVAGALRHAAEAKLKPLGVAVHDARGALIAFAAQDGNPLKRAEVAMGKAQGALAMGVSSRTLGKMAAERPHFQYRETVSPRFAAWIKGRENRKNDFFTVPAGGVDICAALPPVRKTP